MNEWWDGLESLQRVFWMISIFSTVFFTLQILVSLVGADFDFDVDTESGFSIRAVMAFLMMFGIVGATFLGNGTPRIQALIGASIAGLLAFAFVTAVFAYMAKSDSQGNIRIKNAIGLTAVVYTPIEGFRKSNGMVQLTIQSSIREFEAITDGPTLSTGTNVKVVEIINDSLLLVENIA